MHETKQDYINFSCTTHVQAYLPDIKVDSELHELVATYQKHNHSKSCRKYRNVPCRFNFGQFFTKTTVVAEPLTEDLDEDLKTNMLTRRNEILSLVKQEIDKVFNPSKPQYDPTKTEDEILSSLGITDSDFDLHLKSVVTEELRARN